MRRRHSKNIPHHDRSPLLAPDPGWYCTDSEEYIRSHIVNPDEGIVFKAVEHDCLAAFFIIHFPGNTPDSLGHYMNLDPEALDRVAHMDSLAVGPASEGEGFNISSWPAQSSI
ncbi:MAG: hypothetical protein ACLRMW_02480 [[Clostridium] symbiosum]